MTTLITGHGMLGTYVVAALRVLGEPVVVFDLDPPESREGLTGARGDVTQLEQLTAVMDAYRPERIIHTAALLTPAGRARPYETALLNVGGTVNVLEAARAIGVARVVLCSSVVVYDATVSTALVGEDHPCAPRTLYSATKLSAEMLGREYARAAGFRFVAARLAAVFGFAARPSGGGVSAVVHDALQSALRDGRASLRRRWLGRQELLYAQDAATALVAAAFAANLEHDVFNVSSGQLVSVEDLGTAIAEITGARIEVVEADDDQTNRDVASAPIDLRRAAAELGWHPAYDLQRGLREYAAQLGAVAT